MAADIKELSREKCEPCKGGIEPLKGDQLNEYADSLPAGWEIIEEKKLRKQFKFDDFKQALDFTVKVGNLAEEQQHHPDIYLSWGKVGVEIWSHKIAGLHKNDFILASKIEQL